MEEKPARRRRRPASTDRRDHHRTQKPATASHHQKRAASTKGPGSAHRDAPEGGKRAADRQRKGPARSQRVDRGKQHREARDPRRDASRKGRSQAPSADGRPRDRSRRPAPGAPKKGRGASGNPIIQKHMLPGGFASSLDGSRPQRGRLLLFGAVALAALLFLWHPWTGAAPEPEPEPAAEQPRALTLEERLATFPAAAPVSPADLSRVPDDAAATVGFTLGEGDAPAIGDEEAAAVDAALAPLTKDGAPAGFLLMDLQTGRGFARNIDEEIYGASSFKAPFCLYICENKVDTGEFTLASKVTDGKMTKSGGFISGGKEELANLISDSIVWSDNGSFGALRKSFSDGNLAAWLETLDVDADIAYDEWFPHYTVRDAARLWTEMYRYLGDDTAGAQLLDESLRGTETSFVRDALEAYAETEAEAAAGEAADEHVDPETGHYYSEERIFEVEASAADAEGEGSGAEAEVVAQNVESPEDGGDDGQVAVADADDGDENREDAQDGASAATQTQGGSDGELVVVRGKAG